MKPLLKLITALFLLATPIFANYQSIYIPDQVRKDLSEGKTGKYRVETIPTVTLAELKQRAVLGANATLTKNISGTPTFDVIMSADICKVDNPQAYTSTIYEMDLPNGIITCMYAAKGDLYNPMGLFKVMVPEIKAYYAINTDAAKTARAAEISMAEAQFAPLLAKKQEISSQMAQQTNASFLTIPELLMAAVLTDDEIIDIEATRATGKFQLKSGYTSKFTESSEVVDNSEYLLTDAATIFEVYVGLSSVSMNFLLILVIGFAAYGGVRFFGEKMANKIENRKDGFSTSPYIFGIFAGILLFFPVDYSHVNGAEGQAEYELLKTNYQGFEKFGYYTFADWAKQSAKVIIDAEVDALIRKSGLGTKEQIVNTWALKRQSEKLDAFYTLNYNTCTNDIYKSDYLTHSDGKSVFGETDKAMFPSSEHWAYTALVAKSLANGHYDKGDRGSLQDGAAGEGEYPKFAFSACGKADYLSSFHKDRQLQFENSYNMLVDTSADNTVKMGILEEVFKFQYKLYRDWGYLAILGLPITKMQTEYVGGFKSKTNEVLDKLNERISGDNTNLHSIMSTLPYIFIPGAHSVYSLVKDNSVIIGAAAGGVAGASQAHDGVLSGLLAFVGGGVGAAAGAIPGVDSALGVIFSYQTAKIVLSILPVIGITAIAVMRFSIIIVKVFSFHFVSLFILPVIFIQQNLQAMGKLSIRAVATMLEIPIFVLSIWLALTASSIVYTVGTVFSKETMLGLLKNSLAADGVNPQANLEVAGVNLSALFTHAKIYFFDGFMEVIIAVFSIVIAYKIIISLHTSLFEMIDMQASNALDNSIESMKNEATSWGSRI